MPFAELLRLKALTESTMGEDMVMAGALLGVLVRAGASAAELLYRLSWMDEVMLARRLNQNAKENRAKEE